MRKSRGPSKRLVRCCLKVLVAQHAQNTCKALLKGPQMWTQPLYYHVFKTDYFRCDSVLALGSKMVSLVSDLAPWAYGRPTDPNDQFCTSSERFGPNAAQMLRMGSFDVIFDHFGAPRAPWDPPGPLLRPPEKS